MDQGFKKISVFGLVLLIALPLVFTVVILVKQKIIQFQRNVRFDKEILQTVVVPTENIYWVKPGKEILLDGKLFDVKSFKTAGNRISLTGFFDHKEDKLVKRIVELARHKNKSGNPFNNLVIPFLFFPFFMNPAEIAYEGNWRFISQQYYLFDEMIPSARSYSLSPPPKS
jgi:hypothetical protein